MIRNENILMFDDTMKCQENFDYLLIGRETIRMYCLGGEGRNYYSTEIEQGRRDIVRTMKITSSADLEQSNKDRFQ